jgi:hypothetical protein
MLGPDGEKARRSDYLVAAVRDERDLCPGSGGLCRLPDEGGPLIAGLRLHDAQPAPRTRVARGEPEALFVLGRERLEARDAPFERR